MVYRRTDITELLGHFFANKWITRWAVTFNDIVQFIVKVFINLHTVHAVQTQISNWNSRSFKQAFAQQHTEIRISCRWLYSFTSWNELRVTDGNCTSAAAGIDATTAGRPVGADVILSTDRGGLACKMERHCWKSIIEMFWVLNLPRTVPAVQYFCTLGSHSVVWSVRIYSYEHIRLWSTKSTVKS